jgi:hypothetical protein
MRITHSNYQVGRIDRGKRLKYAQRRQAKEPQSATKVQAAVVHGCFAAKSAVTPLTARRRRRMFHMKHLG